MPDIALQGAIGAVASAIIGAIATIIAARITSGDKRSNSLQISLVATISAMLGFYVGVWYDSSPTSKPPVNDTVTCELDFEEFKIPNGTEMVIRVEVGTVHALTSGPICVEGNCLPGGKTRGSVTILRPRDTPYHITGLVPTKNWHGVYHKSCEDWRSIASDRVRSMKNPGNCTDGSACDDVDVMVIGDTGLQKKYTE